MSATSWPHCPLQSRRCGTLGCSRRSATSGSVLGSYRLYGLDGNLIPHAKCPWVDVLATGQSFARSGNRHRATDGARIVALVNIAAIKDSAGRVVGAVNVFREKPEHFPATLASMGTSETRRASAGLACGGLYHGRAGRITFYNDAAASFGASSRIARVNSAAHGSCIGLTAALAASRMPDALALKEKRPIRAWRHRREAGWDADSVIPYQRRFSTHRCLTGAVNTLVDITERHQAEQRMRESEPVIEVSRRSSSPPRMPS